jgi:short-subunit dehydrogenase
MAVNYQGIVNGIEAVLPAMLERGHGHIGFVSSIAGYRGLPRALAYGPSKAALINLAEGLRNDLAARGIRLSVINPGYVATPMTADNKFPMPFMVPVERAARKIVRGLQRGKYEITFPWQLVALAKLGRLLPNGMFFWYARTFLAPPRNRK